MRTVRHPMKAKVSGRRDGTEGLLSPVASHVSNGDSSCGCRALSKIDQRRSAADSVKSDGVLMLVVLNAVALSPIIAISPGFSVVELLMLRLSLGASWIIAAVSTLLCCDVLVLALES